MRDRPRALVDDAIACAEAAFSPLVELVRVPGAHIDRRALQDCRAEVLLTRSVTRVDDELLSDTRVRFVGTATAGVDHVDLSALRARDISFASAPGCNAPAVVHWVLTALASACARAPERWSVASGVGVVGHGNVGARLARRLRALGCSVRVCDPPLARHLQSRTAPSGLRFEALARLLAETSVVTLHVPLTRAPVEHPTYHLLDARNWPRAAVINSSRGAVVDAAAVLAADAGQVVLDVWEGEPELDARLLAPGGPVLFASPHVAGYSRASKRVATGMLHRALARFLGAAPRWRERDGRAPPRPLTPTLDGCASATEALARCLQATCALLDDDRRVRALCSRPPGPRREAFEALRRGYDLRLEPEQHLITPALERALAPWLERPVALGGAPLRHALELVGLQRATA